MSSPPLRFVHASDFHLEAPPSGIADVPAHLRDVLVDAAYDAARKVFDTVLAEDGEFLVLSGDIVAPERAGPRGVLFLAEQCQRLADQNIPVYWLRGRYDPTDDWPTESLLPANVHLFPSDRCVERIHQRGDCARARLIAMGAAHQPQGGDASGDDHLFTIGIMYGDRETAPIAHQLVDYWAMGGAHNRRDIAGSTTIVHYPGTPQGRHPGEAGPHGCTVVEAESSQEVHAIPIDIDVVRWQLERLQIDETVDATSLELQARERLQRLMVDQADRHLLVSWRITGTGPLKGALRRGKLRGDLLAKLQSEFGHQSPAIWSIDLEASAEGGFPTTWYEEETMLGEFLRNVRGLQTRPKEPIDFGSMLQGVDSLIAAAVTLEESPTREAALRRAAVLGVDLLRGDEPASGTGKLGLR